jgi:hypothetical protein
MLSLDLIKSAIHNGSYGSPSGCTCVFVPITDKIGAKLYTQEYDRDNCYGKQNQAKEFDLGPETYGLFEFVLDHELVHEEAYDNIPEGQTVYGYLTEIVEVARDKYDFYEFRGKFPMGRDNLVRDLKDKCNISWLDTHMGNIGIKDGKLMCIDFD